MFSINYCLEQIFLYILSKIFYGKTFYMFFAIYYNKRRQIICCPPPGWQKMRFFRQDKTNMVQ